MVFFILLSGCRYRPLDDQKPLKIVVANDLHYAHQSMIFNHERTRELTFKADGKQINYIGEITDAFIEDMKQLKPDVIILNGDLVFNGERDNHQYLSKKLKALDSLVLVNTGNHDINSPSAIKMLPQRSHKVASVSDEEYQRIYRDFGFKQANSQDINSLSYKVEVSESLHIIMLDSRCDNSCENIHSGQIKAETLDWLDQQLEASKEMGAEVLLASHHNVLVHYPRLNEGFTINNHQQLIDLLNEYDVKLALSGHIHVQHIAQDDGLTDIATGSLAVYQNQFGIIDYIPKDSFEYRTQVVDVSGYAEKMKFDNLELLNFEKTSLQTITEVNYRKTAFRLYDEMMVIHEQDILNIASYDAKMKAYYFSGQLADSVDEFLSDDEFNRLNEDYSFETYNMRSAIKNFGDRDHRKIKINLK